MLIETALSKYSCLFYSLYLSILSMYYPVCLCLKLYMGCHMTCPWHTIARDTINRCSFLSCYFFLSPFSESVHHIRMYFLYSYYPVTFMSFSSACLCHLQCYSVRFYFNLIWLNDKMSYLIPVCRMNFQCLLIVCNNDVNGVLFYLFLLFTPYLR